MNENADKGKKSQSEENDLPQINFLYKTMRKNGAFFTINHTN